MRYFSRFLSLAAIFTLSSTLLNAEETMICDLRVQDNFKSANQFSVDKDEDPWLWARYNVNNEDVSGPEQYNSNYTDGYYSSAFYTDELNLEAGNYKVYTKPRKKNSDYATSQACNLYILLGQGDMTEAAYNRGDMKELAHITGISYASTYSGDAFSALPTREVAFTIETPGKYKIAFFNKGAGLTLHNTYIVKVEGSGGTDPDPDPDPDPEPDPVVPDKVSDLSASQTDTNEVTITFSLPYEGTKGESLAGESLTYTIYRDSAKLSSKGRQAAGASITYVDNDVDFATYTYSVDVTVGEQTGERESVTVTVERPRTPMTTVNLPFADSFAGAYLDESKWTIESSGGKGIWSAISVVMPGMFLGDWKAQDDDGGFASYDGWNGNNGDFSRLITAPISKSSSSAPVVDLWFRHSHSPGCKNYIKVQVSADEGEWQDVQGAQMFTYTDDLPNGGWVYYKYSLSPYIDGCTSYRVAFTGYNDGISTYLPIDNVNIYNMSDKDLRLLSVNVPTTAYAGKEMEIEVELENMGGATIAADAYTITAESDFPGEIVFSNVTIPSLESVKVTGKVEVTAEEVLDGPVYSIKVNVNLPGNAGSETLTSETKTINTAFNDYKIPEGISANYDTGGRLLVTWESVKDLDHSPINVMETFDGLQARQQIEVNGEKVWQDGAKGNFNDFISVDLDHRDGGSYYSTSGSEFQVFKDFMTGSLPQGHSGQYIGLTLPPNTQQDDWLITPALDAAETALISLQARIAYIHYESDAYNNTLEVLYSTEDYNKNNPAPSFTKSLLSTTSKASSSDIPHDGLYHWLRINTIPSEAKYVALHFITKSAMQTGVWIDRIWLSETDQQPLSGYYVYQRGAGRLNDTPLPVNQLQFVKEGVSHDTADKYYVTALYDTGESYPSDIVGIGSTGVLNPDTSDTAISSIPGGILISGYSDTEAFIYSLDGQTVASALCSGSIFVSLPPGLYIVKAGDATAKLIVK